ncbi:hypothetical protein BofuT4_uP018480.1 [Botrytis cinerea T4]|uniref:Uncharacterized protein n=1 Tax=Botryotinia fuckeliana (strain T4) TaxID=999810 RepID=G2YIK5_BOTF4|nr:hypothetical protein BofuT4_uP018480.1 [Botrytis cinerea T4]
MICCQFGPARCGDHMFFLVGSAIRSSLRSQFLSYHISPKTFVTRGWISSSRHRQKTSKLFRISKRQRRKEVRIGVVELLLG